MKLYSITELLHHINKEICNNQIIGTVQSMYDPINYSLTLSSKRVRPLLMLMSYNLFKENISDVYTQAQAIEMFHTSTLLHDDLMDESPLRRGVQTVYRKWSPNQAILSGDAMVVLANQMMCQAPIQNISKVMAAFTKAQLEVCEGQQLDLQFETLDIVSTEEYLQMIRLKTAVLLACSLEIGALLAGADDSDVADLYLFGINIGLAFQIQDDMLDTYGDAKILGKQIGDDIASAKKTILLIHAYQQADIKGRKEIMNLIQNTSIPLEERLPKVITLFDHYGVHQYALDLIEQYNRKAFEALNNLSAKFDVSMLKEFACSLMKRNK